MQTGKKLVGWFLNESRIHPSLVIASSVVMTSVGFVLTLGVYTTTGPEDTSRTSLLQLTSLVHATSCLVIRIDLESILALMAITFHTTSLLWALTLLSCKLWPRIKNSITVMHNCTLFLAHRCNRFQAQEKAKDSVDKARGDMEAAYIKKATEDLKVHSKRFQHYHDRYNNHLQSLDVSQTIHQSSDMLHWLSMAQFETFTESEIDWSVCFHACDYLTLSYLRLRWSCCKSRLAKWEN